MRKLGVRKHPFLIALSVLLVLAFIFLLVLYSGRKAYDYVVIGGKTITAEVARTPDEMQRGLMLRESLCSECGMLFVFNEGGYYSFWMKNTLIPLDIIFIDANLTVVDIFHAVPCASEPCQTYTPSREALYVLEVNGNKFGDNITGTRVGITGENYCGN